MHESPCCPQCDGDAVFLGQLGIANAFRCRNCGWDWSESVYPEAESNDDEDDGQPDEAQEWHDFDPDC